MPAPHDLDPPSMTEDERLEKRRYQAGFAFEMGHPTYRRADLDSYGQGTPPKPDKANHPNRQVGRVDPRWPWTGGL